MTAVVIVVVAFFFVVLATWAWRSMWSERRSIDSHEHAMEVLREMAEKREDQVNPAGRDGRPSSQHVRPGAVPDLRPRRDLVERMAEHSPARPALSQERAEERPSLAENLAEAARHRESQEGPSRSSGRRRVRAARLSPKPRTVFVSEDLGGPGTAEGHGSNPGATGLAGAAGPAGAQIAGGATVGEGDAAAPIEVSIGEQPLAEGFVVKGPAESGATADATRVEAMAPLADALAAPGARVSRRARRASTQGQMAPRSSGGVLGRLPGARGVVVAVAAAAVVVAIVVPSVVLSGGTTPRGGAGRAGTASTSNGHQGAPPAQKPTAVVPVRSDQNGAVYQLTSASYVLSISANGPCWIDVLQGQGGPQVFEGTLQAGEVHTVSANGPIWVRVGDAAHMSATIDEVPVTMPGANGAPYDLSFVPA
jgi:RodZ C-terminal domain